MDKVLPDSNVASSADDQNHADSCRIICNFADGETIGVGGLTETQYELILEMIIKGSAFKYRRGEAEARKGVEAETSAAYLKGKEEGERIGREAEKRDVLQLLMARNNTASLLVTNDAHRKIKAGEVVDG